MWCAHAVRLHSPGAVSPDPTPSTDADANEHGRPFGRMKCENEHISITVFQSHEWAAQSRPRRRPPRGWVHVGATRKRNLPASYPLPLVGCSLAASSSHCTDGASSCADPGRPMADAESRSEWCQGRALVFAPASQALALASPDRELVRCRGSRKRPPRSGVARRSVAASRLTLYAERVLNSGRVLSGLCRAEIGLKPG